MQANAYLQFDGTCEAALAFYAAKLGARIQSKMPFEGSPAAEMMPPDRRNLVLHAQFTIGDTMLMASDVPPGHYETPRGFRVTLGTKDAAEAERVFAALSEAGTVAMPMAETFFAQRFGMVTDKFGIPWMVICEQPH